MDLQHFATHLDHHIKNMFILDLILKDETLAMEAFNTFTPHYSWAETTDLVHIFYHQFDVGDNKVNFSNHNIVKQFRHEIDSLYLNSTEKELREGYVGDMITHYQTHFYNFEEDTFNALIELTNKIKNKNGSKVSEKKKLEWLNTITAQRENYATVAPHIHSSLAKDILIQHFDNLDNRSVVNLLVNTDMVNWFNFEGVIEKKECKDIIPGYFYKKPKDKISLKIALLCELMESHSDMAIKHKVLTHLYHSSSPEQIKSLTTILEYNSMNFVINSKNMSNIELIEQYIAFSHTKQFMNGLSSFQDLIAMVESSSDVIDFLLSDTKIKHKDIELIHKNDLDELVNLLDELFERNYFCDIDKLTKILRFTYLAEKSNTNSDIISSLIECFQEYTDDIYQMSSYMNKEHITATQAKLENLLLDSTLKKIVEKKNTKNKI